MSKNKWEIIHDADTEEGEPTTWSMEINHEKYGKFVWVCQYDINDFRVEVDLGDFVELVTCKSLASAKRWVTMNLL